MSLDVCLTGELYGEKIELFGANYTHNCRPMATEAGVASVVWFPIENGVTLAGQVIEPLAKGIALMEADPERFKALNPKNGWGSYDTFLPWLREYLTACIRFPKADVWVSRWLML